MEMSSVAATQRTALPSFSDRKSKGHSDMYFDTFHNEIEEKGVLQKIEEAWKARDIEIMFQLIKENTFNHMEQKKVLQFWDWGHYYVSEKATGKPLTALSRFRLREKNIPPPNIAPNGRQKSTLPPEATAILRNWLDTHRHRPYPKREEKQLLAEITGLTITQVNTWFANSRRRMSGRRAEYKRSWNRTSPQPWHAQVPITTTPSAFTPFSCANNTPTALTSLGVLNSHCLWPENSTFTPMDWHTASRAAGPGDQYLSTSVVALAPAIPLWKPELQYCGLHAAAQILMDMSSRP